MPPRRKAMFLVGALVLLLLAAAAWFVLRPVRLGEAEAIRAARDYLAKRDSDSALIVIRDALQRNDSSGEARLLFARALLASGDADAAQIELDRARTLGADAEEWQLTRADLLLARQRPEEVIAEFRPSPGQEALALKVVRALAMSGDSEGARQRLAAIQQARPDLLEARLLSVQMAAARGEASQALAAVEAILSAHPASAEAWALKGDLLHQTSQDPAPARAAYRKAIELQPRLLEPHAQLVQSHLQRGETKAAIEAADAMRKVAPKSSQAIYMQALAEYVAGNFEAAKARLQLLQFNDNARLLSMAGAIESRLGNLVQADAYLSRSLQLGPAVARTRRELASVHLLRGQPERALVTLQPLLSASNPPDAEAWRLAGQAMVRSGDFARAEQAFKMVRKADPKNQAVTLETGRLLIARGRFDEGVRELESARQADDQGVSATLELVSAHLARKDSAAALSALQSLQDKMPNASTPHLIRGRIQAQSGRLAEARQAFETALAKQPDLLPAVQALAELDVVDKQFDKALARYKAFLEQQPRSTQAMLGMAELLRRTGADKAKVLEWVDKAVATEALDPATWQAAVQFHRDAGDSAAALSRARAAMAALPDNPELLAMLASAQLSEGDTLQAIGSLNRLAELRPASHDVQLMLSEAQVLAGKPERALAAALKARELQPQSRTASRGVVRAALAANQPDKALDVARDLQKRSPADPTGWLLEGEVAMVQRKWDAATAAFKSAFAKAPSGDTAWSLQAALRGAGRNDEARKVASDWLAQNPGDTTLLNRLGEAAQMRGELDQAEEHYRQALKMQPDSPVFMNNLAYVMVLRKNPAALDMAIKAAEAAPYSPPVLDTLAHALAASGDVRKAVEMQARVVDLAPRTTEYRIHLARLHLKAGDKSKARDELDRVQSQIGEGKVPAEVRQLIEQARG